jgi:hypothetical protein
MINDVLVFLLNKGYLQHYGIIFFGFFFNVMFMASLIFTFVHFSEKLFSGYYFAGLIILVTPVFLLTTLIQFIFHFIFLIGLTAKKNIVS